MSGAAKSADITTAPGARGGPGTASPGLVGSIVHWSNWQQRDGDAPGRRPARRGMACQRSGMLQPSAGGSAAARAAARAGPGRPGRLDRALEQLPAAPCFLIGSAWSSTLGEPAGWAAGHEGARGLYRSCPILGRAGPRTDSPHAISEARRAIEGDYPTRQGLRTRSRWRRMIRSLRIEAGCASRLWPGRDHVQPLPWPLRPPGRGSSGERG